MFGGELAAVSGISEGVTKAGPRLTLPRDVAWRLMQPRSRVRRRLVLPLRCTSRYHFEVASQPCVFISEVHCNDNNNSSLPFSFYILDVSFFVYC